MCSVAFLSKSLHVLLRIGLFVRINERTFVEKLNVENIALFLLIKHFSPVLFDTRCCVVLAENFLFPSPFYLKESQCSN